MTIYTKTGDDGITETFKGCRVNKDTPLMEAIGTIDELNSILGVVLSLPKSDLSSDALSQLPMIQKDLFVVGSMLAGDDQSLELTPLCPPASEGQVIDNLKKRITSFEKEIDKMWEVLPPLKNFILPGGTNVAAMLFLARAVCRRVERRVVTLKKYPQLVKYLNRLSDYLFVLARYVNFLAKEKEIVWMG